MKASYPDQLRRQEAFTLIELLVVMAIIALLAALIIPLAGTAIASAQKSRVSAELTKLETAISAYKDKVGFYPPDNPIGPQTNQLYYELTGTIYNQAQGIFTNADGTFITTDTINKFFGVNGFANTTQNPVEKPPYRVIFEPKDFDLVDSNPPVRLLVCPVTGPHMVPATSTPGGTATGKLINPWCYESSHPTNNPNSYDLWVDVLIRGKTNRFCNWSSEPVILK